MLIRNNAEIPLTIYLVSLSDSILQCYNQETDIDTVYLCLISSVLYITHFVCVVSFVSSETPSITGGSEALVVSKGKNFSFLSF